MSELDDLLQRLLPDISVEIGSVEILDRAAGLNRPGVIAQFSWPRLDTRLGLGIEPAIAHAVVDHLLGFKRLPAEASRQVTPVEFGIITFVMARAIDRLDARPGPWGAWDLTIDRVGPDPFDPRDLGPIITCRWSAKIGASIGSFRLWFPESLLSYLAGPMVVVLNDRPSFASLASTWRAEAGPITLSRGLSGIKTGGVRPIDAASLRGTVASPVGRVGLVCRDRDGCTRIDVEPVPNTASARVLVQSPPYREMTPREPIAMNPPLSSTANSADLPVTLVAELGRINLTLSRIADIKVGDVLELGRHSREPVELTSNGKLVARGELVQIDTELGVRIISVFL